LNLPRFLSRGDNTLSDFVRDVALGEGMSGRVHSRRI